MFYSPPVSSTGFLPALVATLQAPVTSAGGPVAGFHHWKNQLV